MPGDEFIERKICIGLIVDDEFARQVLTIWDGRFLESPTARIICGWCVDYAKQYDRAPGRDIEGIYSEKIKGLSKENAEWIEDILNSLDEEWDQEKHTDYLLEQTEKYFKKRSLLLLSEDLRIEAENGDIAEAEKVASAFLPVSRPDAGSIDPFTDSACVKRAFESRGEPLFTFPKALGHFWNHQLVREGFIALLAPEKRGKTFMLMEFAFRALRKGLKVVLFQAGDMSEEQMIRRMGIYLTGRSDMEKHCEPLLVPVLDCRANQTDECDHADRECNEGVLTDPDAPLDAIINKASRELKIESAYRPCHNCPNIKGSPWYKIRPSVPALTWKDAYKALKEFRKKYPAGKLKLSTYPNETLTVQQIRVLISQWKSQEGFQPDVIIIDYADLLAPDPDINRMDFRHQQNRIWQRMRALSQQERCLLITATQADARSYDQETLNLTNFSEDKRKLAHVTAMYGLNQTMEEKRAGVIRINELIVRDDAFDSDRTVKVLQSLPCGRPCIGSYF